MKLEQLLIIGGIEYPIVDVKLRLSLKQIGCGFITVRSKCMPNHGVVTLEAFFPGMPRYEIFRGVTGEITSSGQNQIDLFVRELSCALDFDFKFNQRHITARELISSLCKTIGLEIVVPKTVHWLDSKQPDFISLTDCRSALEAAIDVWEIQNGTWFQLTAGRIYFGEYEKSPAFDETVMALSPLLITKHVPELGKIEMITLPKLRPGSRLFIDNRIRIVDQIEYNGTTSIIGFK